MRNKIFYNIYLQVFLPFYLFTFLPLSVSAQRIGCVHTGDRPSTRGDNQVLPMPYDFDSQKTYRMPVVLIAFSDADFTMPDPLSYYDRMLNEKGYNEGVGVGCLADYFRDQSNGRLNIQFDVYGPFKVTQTAGGHGSSYFSSWQPVMPGTRRWVISGLILRTNTFCCQGISIPTFVRSPQSCGETVP